MRKSILLGLTTPVVGLAASFGLAVAVHTADVPNYDQLYQQSQAQAQAQVNAAMAPTPSPTPTVTAATGTTSSTGASDTNSAGNGNNVIVLNTGDNAAVDTSYDQSSTTNVTNNNSATVNQEVNGNANTGGNTASRNISYGGDAGSIQTGNAAVNSSLGTSVNSNTTRVSGTCPDVTTNVTVYNTGDNLNHNSGTSNTCTTTVTNNNDATINQVVNADANTGGNTADRNISYGGSAGSIQTGNASVGSVLVAQGNQNVVIVGGQSNHGAPGSGANIYILNTGDGAVLVDPRRYSTSTNVVNNNTLTSNQEVNANANTGDNQANRNINQNGDAGVIQTGNATVNTALSVDANHNDTYISGSGGNATSNVKIVNTGDNLTSDTQTSVDNTTTVTNNNVADINQVVNANANTGNNQANRNIAIGGDAGVIQTGNATVNTVLSANANLNHTVISGAEGTATSNVNVVNTGDNASVTAGTSTSNTVEVTNNNRADINQVVNVNANTGENEANRNIGGGSITTGGVTINNLAVTHANGNYTFVVDSSSTAASVFNQFVQSLFGLSLGDIMAGHGTVVSGLGGPVAGNNLNVTNTGDDLNVLAQNSTVHTVVVTNNNVSNVNQAVNVNANTGNNQCNRNVGGCDIVTGDVVVNTTLLVDSNFNFTVIGNVQLPQTPEQPSTTPTEQAPEAAPAASQPEVLAAVTTTPSTGTLPDTGANNFGLFGLALVLGGLALRRKATASAKS